MAVSRGSGSLDHGGGGGTLSAAVQGRLRDPALLQKPFACQGKRQHLVVSSRERGLQNSGQCGFILGSTSSKLLDKYLIYKVNMTNVS